VADGEHADVLERIAAPRVGLALWRRTQPRPLARWLSSTPLQHLPHGRVLVRCDHAAKALNAMIRPQRTAGSQLLFADMVDLVERFCAIADTALVDIRIEALAHDGCWKFHYDNVSFRLIATYRGPGTQWVAASDSERALAEQRSYTGMVHDIPTHAAALFRGTSSGSEGAVVHRSPPIARSGKSRLLLVLNLPSATSPPETDVADPRVGSDVPTAVPP
jgi:hypothetical protein